MRSLTLVALFALIAIAFGDVDVSFTNCGGTSPVTKITASAFPPKSGQHLTMHQIHDNFETVASSASPTYKITTKLGSLTVDTKTGSLCEYGSFKCDSAAGAADILLESDVGSVPSGTYTMQTEGSVGGKLIFCQKVTFKI